MNPDPSRAPHRRIAALTLAGLLLVPGCSGPPPRVEGSLLFANALVVDGTGRPAFKGSVRIVGDRILEVGDLEPWRGEPVIDVGGRVLAPGFIDTHSHADAGIRQHPAAEALVSQGVTTAVVGNDGSSELPLASLVASLEAAPVAVNLASYTGHGSLRERVMGQDYRRHATAAEIEQMGALLAADMSAGSLGLSSGLEYDPGIYSDTAELVALARVAASHGGRYISHLRSEDRHFWGALEEIIQIGREAAIPVQVSHMKLAMKALWGEADTALALMDAARAEGIDITADVYPYAYWQSTLTVLFPERRYDDLDEARYVVDQLVPPEGALIADFLPTPEYAGKTLAEIAALRGEEPAVSLLALIEAAEKMRDGAVEEPVESVIGTSMSEPDIERLLAWPHSNFCTDGELDGSHPRGYGSFARVLGRYVRERGVMGLEAAIRKASALAAAHVGITDRGTIAAGLAADVVIFDPGRIVDRASLQAPHATALGIEQVWVNGVRVWDGTAVTGARPGKALRRPSR